MKEKINIAFISFCFLIAITPLTFLCFNIKTEDSFSSAPINSNFERNFPLKEDLFQIYAFIKENIYQTNAVPTKVIDTKNGWLFCGDDYSDNLSESKGILTFSEKELDQITDNIRERNKWFTKNGIDFYIAIAPNKETIYGDMIPIKKSNKKTKREQVRELCLEKSIQHIDLGELFPENPTTRLYHKTDTHWNEIAGFYAYQAIMNQLETKYPNKGLVPKSIHQFKIEVDSTHLVGDLNDMIKRHRTEAYIGLNYTLSNPAKAVEIEKQLQIPEGCVINPLVYERRFTSAVNDLKILIFGDSFFPYTTKFINEHFGETVVIWNQKFNPDLILNEKPDIVILEIVERNIDFLINY